MRVESGSKQEAGLLDDPGYHAVLAVQTSCAPLARTRKRAFARSGQLRCGVKGTANRGNPAPESREGILT